VPEADNEEAQIHRAKVIYTRSPDYRTVHVSGLLGGITPRGEIRCHLFVEGPHPPSSGMLSVDPETGEVHDEPNPPDEIVEEGIGTYVEREIQVSIVVHPQQAASMGQWFADHHELWASRQASGMPEEAEMAEDELDE